MRRETTDVEEECFHVVQIDESTEEETEGARGRRVGAHRCQPQADAVPRPAFIFYSHPHATPARQGRDRRKRGITSTELDRMNLIPSKQSAKETPVGRARRRGLLDPLVAPLAGSLSQIRRARRVRIRPLPLDRCRLRVFALLVCGRGRLVGWVRTPGGRKRTCLLVRPLLCR